VDGRRPRRAAGRRGRRDLVTGLRTVLADVRAVDEDAPRMRARALELADRLDELAAAARAGPRRRPRRRPAEAAALLRWLADGNFVFLGARDVELVRPPRQAARAPCPAPGWACCAATPT
jgi:glutamate dehydrogenase